MPHGPEAEWLFHPWTTRCSSRASPITRVTERHPGAGRCARWPSGRSTSRRAAARPRACAAARHRSVSPVSSATRVGQRGVVQDRLGLVGVDDLVAELDQAAGGGDGDQVDLDAVRGGQVLGGDQRRAVAHVGRALRPPRPCRSAEPEDEHDHRAATRGAAPARARAPDPGRPGPACRCSSVARTLAPCVVRGPVRGGRTRRCRGCRGPEAVGGAVEVDRPGAAVAYTTSSSWTVAQAGHGRGRRREREVLVGRVHATRTRPRWPWPPAPMAVASTTRANDGAVPAVDVRVVAGPTTPGGFVLPTVEK